MVWGLAIALVTVLLYKDRDKQEHHIFWVGVFLGGAYEYICSVFTELLFGKIFWDYSAMSFNLGGRINLLYCFFWGIAAVVWIKGIYPKAARLINIILKKTGCVLTGILMVFMVFNIFVWEMDYDEIRNLDVGSFFDSRFAGERVPLLSEVIAFAKENGIKLNIEMKPTGHEHEFEQKVAEVIETEKFVDQCVVTSQVYDVLEKMKSCDSRIRTVYVMSIAYGDISALTAADHFSIEASNVTEKLVSDVHNAGKEIYVWTVNTEESINRMIDLNVDNIITDDITLAKECIYLSKTSDVVLEYVKWLSK